MTTISTPLPPTIVTTDMNCLATRFVSVRPVVSGREDPQVAMVSELVVLIVAEIVAHILKR